MIHIDYRRLSVYRLTTSGFNHGWIGYLCPGYVLISASLSRKSLWSTESSAYGRFTSQGTSEERYARVPNKNQISSIIHRSPDAGVLFKNRTQKRWLTLWTFAFLHTLDVSYASQYKLHFQSDQKWPISVTKNDGYLRCLSHSANTKRTWNKETFSLLLSIFYNLL